jgi:hypothetical protein
MSSLNKNPLDDGMVYTETNLDNLFAEPLNALTSCIFIIMAIYWMYKLKLNFKQYPFLIYLSIWLITGGIGGAIFHAFRKYPFFIILDWLPMMVICLSTGVFFLNKLFNWFFAFLLTTFYFFILISFSYYFLRNGNGLILANLNYAFLGSMVLVPMIIYLYKTDWKNGVWVGFGFIAFLFALLFRITDQWKLLSSGTHFIWHCFGAMAYFCMFKYIYLIRGKII